MINPTGHKFYMQRHNLEEELEEVKNLEESFDGMVIRSVDGLRSYGKIKNIYTESIPNESTLHVWQTEKPKRETTNIVISAMFYGDTRATAYDSFVEYISGRKVDYWDDVRNLKATLLLQESISLDDEMLYGGVPYFTVDFTFTNINGKTESVAE